MVKTPTPTRADGLRAMREAQFAKTPTPKAPKGKAEKPKEIRAKSTKRPGFQPERF